ncbi:aminomethyltransferase family protein [Stagnihabitans tardus]|uniref:Aminomethyl transferase family protein n=1 Tax=Stagnihabitans tardus TaxID=2699202 RepID=A0AAE4YAG6_9RHOB|nr:aminomethyltransferase family protein [Stagnihabitans tardus]NBZ86440.1 aminomethyl transferase family protein [Stagnihabitans tardus]
MTLRRTPFHALASAMGAQMGPVGGGFLNVHSYGDAVAEHLNTRARVGVQDLSTMGKIDVKGPEAEALVNHLIVNDAARMAPGQARYASVCAHDGGIMDDLTVFRLGSEHFLIVTGSRNRLKIRDWVAAHATGRRAYVTDITAAVAFPTVQGPNSRALLQGLIPDADLTALKRWTFTFGHLDGTRVMISRTGVTGELGFELFVPSDEAAGVWMALFRAGGALGLRPYGVNAMFTLGLEKLYPAHGIDMDESLTPFHVGTDAFIKFDKGDFIGREALLRVRDAGVATTWVGLVLGNDSPVPAMTPVMAGGRAVGHVTYSDHGPSVGAVLASAHLATDVATEAAPVTVLGRPATVTRRAFFDPEGLRLRS